MVKEKVAPGVLQPISKHEEAPPVVPGWGALPKDMEERTGDWVCDKCRYRNFARNRECRGCPMAHLQREKKQKDEEAADFRAMQLEERDRLNRQQVSLLQTKSSTSEKRKLPSFVAVKKGSQEPEPQAPSPPPPEPDAKRPCVADTSSAPEGATSGAVATPAGGLGLGGYDSEDEDEEDEDDAE
mmetsp:Transcript_5431/g.15723  ORF Transcript_5431/g.15723 Transcript_5431/m.15723 type:complete len:184 (-) Transcript_5431:92-643(-)